MAAPRNGAAYRNKFRRLLVRSSGFDTAYGRILSISRGQLVGQIANLSHLPQLIEKIPTAYPSTASGHRSTGVIALGLSASPPQAGHTATCGESGPVSTGSRSPSRLAHLPAVQVGLCRTTLRRPHFVHTQPSAILVRPVSQNSRGLRSHCCHSCRVRRPHFLQVTIQVLLSITVGLF